MKEEEQIGVGWGPWALSFPPHAEVAWSRIGNSLLGRLIGICCPGDKEIICEIMGRGGSLPGAGRSLGGSWLVGAAQNAAGTARATVRSQGGRGCPAPPRSGTREGKSVTVCEITGTKDACHSQEFVMGTILSLCNCSLENVLFLIKAT